MIWLKISQYLSLIRFYNQAGTILLFIPCFYGMVYVREFSMTKLIVFFVSAFLARSCGCILNDIADRKIDSQIPTTSKRAIASVLVSVKNALILFAVLVLCGVPLLVFYSVHVFLPLAIIGVLVAIYPYSKRFFAMPQLVLGIVYASGFLIAIVDVKNYPIWRVDLRMLAVYFSLVLWVIVYDTIYAKRDFEYDKATGVNSAAVFFEKEYHKLLPIAFCFFALLALSLNVYTWLCLCFFVIVGFFMNIKIVTNQSEAKVNGILFFLIAISNGILLYGQGSYGIIFPLCAMVLQVYSVFLPAMRGFKINILSALFIVWCL